MTRVDGLAPEEALRKAKGYALRLFKLRPRSEAELKAKLRDKGFTEDVSSRIIGEFKELGYIDDTVFARIWMQSRLKKYGFRRVARELTQKGILKEYIIALWEDLRGEHDEAAVARDIVERRARLYKDIPVLKRKKRIMDFLARRGFSAETINKVIREL